MEACGGAHFWGREIGNLGREVRLIPLAYVKPFVKRQKNDAADAEAICETAQRPTMHFVPVNSEQRQGSAMRCRVREVLSGSASSSSMPSVATSRNSARSCRKGDPMS